MRALALALMAAIRPDPAFVRAERAFMQHDLPAAEQAYREVLAADTATQHRTQAAITLASIAWRVRRDTAAAGDWLRRVPVPGGRFAAMRERAIMRLAFGDVAGARAAADSAARTAVTMAEREAAEVVLGQTAVAPALAARVKGEPLTPAEASVVRTATARLRTVVERAPGALEPARLLIAAAILSENGPAVLTGWRSYYLVAAGDSVSGWLSGPRRVLEARLPALRPGAGTRADRLAIVQALADSRLFPAAAALALAADSGSTAPADADPRAREIVAYARFLADVERTTDEYYRDTLLGASDPSEWRSALIYRGARLWPRLMWGGPVPAFSADGLAAELDRRFGAVVNMGETAGYQDLHYGHRVVDERRTVTQYGHEAAVRFVALDGMVSNGFQSWAWNGRAGHGGWATAETIIQVRPLYAEGPRKVWRRLHDAAAQGEAVQRLDSDSAADLSRARGTPVAYFPGLAARLERDGHRYLLDSLERTGLRGAALEAAFTRELGRVEVESSIFAHEGRHAIDASDSELSAEEREYRAKLSQVVFAPVPQLALDGILDGTVGDATPHGQANRRVLEGVLGWITNHAREIAGLDPRLPLLLQLPLLTEYQVREAFQSLDPLAR
jgi:hypothetical protein